MQSNPADDVNTKLWICQINNAVLGLFAHNNGSIGVVWYFGQVDFTTGIMKGVHVDSESTYEGHFVAGLTELRNSYNVVSYKFSGYSSLIEVRDLTKYLYAKQLKLSKTDTAKFDDGSTTGFQPFGGWIDYTTSSTKVGSVSAVNLKNNCDGCALLTGSSQ